MSTSTMFPSTSRRLPAPPLASTALDLLDRSRASMLSSCRAANVTERYLQAHLGALRAAAALLAARSRPTGRSRLRSVWEVLPEVAPELSEWAVFFAASAKRRIALERGDILPTAREADDLLRASETFFCLVQASLGLPMSCTLPEFTAAATATPPAPAAVPSLGVTRSRTFGPLPCP